MTIKIAGDRLALEIDGSAVAVACQRPDGWREVTSWSRFFDRNDAITVLTVIELRETRSASDPGVELAA